ncbi:MAG: histidine kinase [Cyclobacteriaceae bacterium]|nr:histidine kinase [Cyclobacteriaceae bacterium]
MKVAEPEIGYSTHPWKQFMIILVVASFIAATFMFVSSTKDWRFILVAFLYTFALWYGNYWFSISLLKKYPLLDQTKKRLVISLVFVFIYTFLVVLIVEGIVFQYEGGKRMFVLFYLIGFFITLLVSAIHGSHNYFLILTQTVKDKEALKRAQVEGELRALASQVNPHFLFNSLNTLVSIIPENAELAVMFTQKLADVYRYVLQSNSRDLVSLAEELEFARNYIFLLKIRFGDNFKDHIYVEDRFMKKRIPVLSLQLLIENASKHNVISDSQPLKLEVTVRENKLVIINNLNSKNATAHDSGTGLDNIRKRYSLFHSDDIVVQKTDKNFVVSIPLIDVEAYESADSRR